MRQFRSQGSVRGVSGNRHSYRDQGRIKSSQTPCLPTQNQKSMGQTPLLHHDMVLECAVASRSQFIVTHNIKDFSCSGEL